MSYEVLLSKLTEGAQDYKPKGDLSYNPDEVTWEDIARCLVGITGGAYHIIRAKYLLDHSSRSGVYASLMVLIMDNGWLPDKRLRSGVWDRIAQTLVWDYMDDRLCPKCNGTGVRIDQKPCKPCDSTGRVKRHEDDIMRASKITPKEWKAIKKRYEYLYRAMMGWEMSGLAKAKSKFYGD